MSTISSVTLPPSRQEPGGWAAAAMPAGVWRGSDWHERGDCRAWPTGYAALDRELPGGGWPGNALVQVQQPPHTHAEWALLLPALARQARQRAGQLVLVAPPYLPFAPALQAAGIEPRRLCCVQRPQGLAAQELAWACEQALHCRDVLAVLAWLPDLPVPALRRLQLAAASEARPMWLWQGLAAEQQSSPATLRLRLLRAGQSGAGQQELQLQILKRRGPALEKPVPLSLAQWAWAPVLQAQAARRAGQSAEAALLMQGRLAAAQSMAV
ncbi:translesion DNA synthesis-associated protein ImuA [Comamonas guangdongensis]|uniref:Translesion DNA synthesis-associated protein ImuA n=1 Tax=Comamonas guangdongensis TaxID=510515 RepID=A0ABV4A020_9BURK